ncbi:MAG: hypothetical protein ACO1N9_13565 [Flavobacterium sp.]
MRHIAFLLLIFLAGCSAPQYAIAKEESDEGGAFTFEILKDKALEIGTGVTGKLHYSLKDAPGTSVAVYKYTKTTSRQYQDNFYNEEVVFEFTGKKITPESIDQSTILFGVSCYCKGKAGHYRVVNLRIIQENENISIDIPKIIDNQIIDSVYIKSL